MERNHFVRGCRGFNSQINKNNTVIINKDDWENERQFLPHMFPEATAVPILVSFSVLGPFRSVDESPSAITLL